MVNNVFVVEGIGYGDEGKGTIVDYLARKYKAKAVVRYNGGSQAAHHVMTPDGVVHCFSQFGSGTFVSGVQTYLSRFMLVDPLAIEAENSALKVNGVFDGLSRLLIDEDCLVVTPFHKIIGRMLEISRGENKHGSCGKGVGRAVEDGKNLGGQVLRIRDLQDIKVLKSKLNFLQQIKIDLAEQLVEEQPDNRELSKYLNNIKRDDYPDKLTETYHNFSISSGVCIVDRNFLKEILVTGGDEESVIFEGAQGALLDCRRGFLPYVTSTVTTLDNAIELIGEAGYIGRVKKIGILRSYATRHGVGPFVTEDLGLTKLIPDMHNGNNEWQGPLRVGWLDLLSVRYALAISKGIDEVALTNLDRFNAVDRIRVCVSYEYIGKNADLLEKYFKLKDGTRKIVGIRSDFKDEFSQKQLTNLLFDCRPLEYKDFQGWKSGLASVCKSEDLPNETQALINFLKSSDGIQTPISIISRGPKWTDKVEV